MTRVMKSVVSTLGVLCLTAGIAVAQTTTASSQMKTFEVIGVDGNTLIVNLPGTRHAVSSPTGCVALLIWQHPVHFVETGAETSSVRVADEVPDAV